MRRMPTPREHNRPEAIVPPLKSRVCSPGQQQFDQNRQWNLSSRSIGASSSSLRGSIKDPTVGKGRRGFLLRPIQWSRPTLSCGPRGPATRRMERLGMNVNSFRDCRVHPVRQGERGRKPAARGRSGELKLTLTILTRSARYIVSKAEFERMPKPCFEARIDRGDSHLVELVVLGKKPRHGL